MPAGILSSVDVATVATDVGRSLREGFYMFWETLWALVGGFTVSGAVQAFVSRDAMQHRLGGRDPASLARASLYGMASSSCSYAASAMARALFARGADFLAAMVFMVASTNLVVELGIVLVVLIGWQFAAAEFIGGTVMIVLLGAAGGLWFRGRALTAASAATGRHAPTPADADAEDEDAGRAGRIRTRAGWADAAGYTLSDLRMLRRELVIGFVVAGFLAVVVPTHLWADVFLRGHGFWTTLENAAVGPAVAVVSFVCSVGNVPLAAALWKGGIGFGGVVSFIFADLITLPLLAIYRKQYGGRMALRILAVFWAVMATTGLVTEYLFRALGWIPRHRPAVVAGDTFRLGPTTLLDVVALVGLAGLVWLYRNRDRLGGGGGQTRDPVCGMQVEVAHAPAVTVADDGPVYFCSGHCQERFEADPHRYQAVGG